MKFDPESKAALILFRRAIDVDPDVVAEEEMKEFLSAEPLDQYELDIVRKLTASGPPTVSGDRNYLGNVDEKLEVAEDNLIASYNRGDDSEWPNELRELIDRERRRLLDDESDGEIDEDPLENDQSSG